MKKRFLSILLTLCMVLVFMPQMAFAAGADNPYSLIEGTNGAGETEGPSRLLDGNSGTKWCVTNFSGAYIIFKTSSAVTVSGYSITTGNDNESNKGRNPKNWTLYGCNDEPVDRNSASWVPIHRVTNDNILEDKNNTTYNFAFDNNKTKYQYYKLEISEIKSGDVMQMSEFALTSCEHSWSTPVTTSPTCTTSGDTRKTCSNCNVVMIYDYKAAGHDFTGENGKCLYCGKTKAEYTYSYLDEHGITQTYFNPNEVTSTDSKWTSTTESPGWYVVNTDVEINSGVTVNGNVHLILADGCILKVSGNITGGSLTIYGQANDTGMLDVSVSITGGVGGNGGNGGGPGGAGENGDTGGGISIIGGTVKAGSITGGTGGSGGNGVGQANGNGGTGGTGGGISIIGGTVEAGSITGGTGGNGGNGDYLGGGGSGGTGGSVSIIGGTVEAGIITGGNGGNGGNGGKLNDGSGGSGGNGGNGGGVSITGGTVMAENITRENGGNGGNDGRSGPYGPGGVGNNGDNGNFSTGTNGNAVIFANSIGDKSNQSGWSGVIFEGNNGQIYGTSVMPCESFTISSGKTLTIESGKTLIIPNGVTLINNGTINNNGKIYVDGTFIGTADNLYYPLTLEGATASGDTSEYNSKTCAKAGSTISLSATPQVGKIITWSSSPNVVISGNSFTMPNEALTVTVQWIDCLHTGDKETRNAKAATCTEEGYTGDTYCKVCEKEISKGTAANMLAHKLDNIPATDATVTETGNKEYWQCKDCKKYFSDEDGNTQITDIESWKTGEGRIDKLPLEMIEGKGQSITAGEKKDLTFRSNAAFGDFIRIELDGKTLDAMYYAVKEGSTIVTLKADYVATLSAGKHTIGIVSKSGTAATTFTVAEIQKPTGNNSNTGSVNHVSKTGDNSHMALWIALMLISGILLSVFGIYGKKKKHNR